MMHSEDSYSEVLKCNVKGVCFVAQMVQLPYEKLVPNPMLWGLNKKLRPFVGLPLVMLGIVSKPTPEEDAINWLILGQKTWDTAVSFMQGIFKVLVYRRL